MIHLDYYQTLEVSPSASDEAIKKSYRKLALRYHPDRNKDNPNAEAKIREINAAYEVLGDPETRKSYERLRFGGFGKTHDGDWGETEETVNPVWVLEEMEKKLWDEARREFFSLMIKKIERVKEELVTIREETVALQGYDTFREDVVKKRAETAILEFVTEEMNDRKQRLLDVACQMMLSQGVGELGDPKNSNWLQDRLGAAYFRGSVDGFCEACELLHVRR